MTLLHRVATPAQAALLLDVRLRTLITRLMVGECSAAGLSRALQTRLGPVHYQLQKLVWAGVAEVSRTEPRAGRPVRYYRVPPRWFIPFEVTGAETLEQFAQGQVMPRMQRFVQLGLKQLYGTFRLWGYWLEHHNQTSSLHLGNPDHTALQLFAGDEPVLFNVCGLRLNRERASLLKQRLLAVLEDEAFQDMPGADSYSLGLLLVQGEVD
ncbi:winged helix-turn-helix domain-containing protein [Deinococcus sonorensis]|uniref:Winged helix-turn-helix domain-containing protein n=2 Tax=Deinococcus sonorensis TaxID=309891 RepID=A0AAU7UBE0_9DEIO